MSAPDETPFTARLRDARRHADPSALAALIPYFGFLGISMSLDARGVLARMAYADDLVGDASIPALHGGTLAALLESAALFQVLLSADADVLPRTITLTVDYLRSGRPRDTFARATVVRQGRRIVVLSVHAFQEDEAAPVASAVVHVLISSDEPAEAERPDAP